MICLMLSKFYGKDHADTQACANVLKSGFRCMYDRSVSDGSDRKLEIDGEWVQNEGCWWSPFGTWYDESWGGISSRWIDAPVCGLDFGNGCYNDHHYHWAYYVVSAAMLVELSPSMKDDTAFVDFVNMFLRDASNPSSSDPYFPQFRTFDWFDMHSWSRGLKANVDGKDQESTSEEVNLHYGMLLWGRAIGNSQMEKLGATMLTMSSRSLQEYFLMRRDNPNHDPKFAKNHVTGIFFQNKVHLTTWFGPDNKYIHGIQMLPLTAAIPLSRGVDFSIEEYQDNLMNEEMSLTDAWTSVLQTGNIALHDPEAAWEKLTAIAPGNYDDGLTKSWALYWTAIQTKAEGGPQPTQAPSTPAPPPPGSAPAPGGIFCNPDPSLGQMCPGNIPCPQCGAGACECP
jgi:endo-1,3(4)-beta-glucanase